MNDKKNKIDKLSKIEKGILIALIPISLLKIPVIIMILSIIELYIIITKNKIQQEIDEEFERNDEFGKTTLQDIINNNRKGDE